MYIVLLFRKVCSVQIVVYNRYANASEDDAVQNESTTHDPFETVLFSQYCIYFCYF